MKKLRYFWIVISIMSYYDVKEDGEAYVKEAEQFKKKKHSMDLHQIS